MKCQARLKKMASKGEPVEYRCLVCATDGKRNISTSVLFTFFLLLVPHYDCEMCFALILYLVVIRPLLVIVISPCSARVVNHRSDVCIFPPDRFAYMLIEYLLVVYFQFRMVWLILRN